MQVLLFVGSFSLFSHRDSAVLDILTGRRLKTAQQLNSGRGQPPKHTSSARQKRTKGKTQKDLPAIPRSLVTMPPPKMHARKKVLQHHVKKGIYHAKLHLLDHFGGVVEGDLAIRLLFVGGENSLLSKAGLKIFTPRSGFVFFCIRFA